MADDSPGWPAPSGGGSGPGVYVGSLAIRHELNDFLAAEGGHIGYSVRPSARRRGHATQALRQALPRCQKLGLARVLLTCDDDNAGSIGVIEANGGVLVRTVTAPSDGRVVRHYWITVSDPCLVGKPLA